MDFDLDKFKTTKPWRDFTFWISAATTVAMLIPVLDDAWNSKKFPTGDQMAGACSPLLAWLSLHGLIRYGSVRAAGEAAPHILRRDTAFPPAGPADPAAPTHLAVDDADLAEARA